MAFSGPRRLEQLPVPAIGCDGLVDGRKRHGYPDGGHGGRREGGHHALRVGLGVVGQVVLGMPVRSMVMVGE